jgi:hypothetical protein
MALKSDLKRTLEQWPALYAGLLRLRVCLDPNAGGSELRLLPRLCRGDETAFDVGSSPGAALDADSAHRLASRAYIDNFMFSARADVLNVLASPASDERGHYGHR